MEEDIQKIGEKIKAKEHLFTAFQDEISRVIVGQKDMVEKILITLIADGHILLEGVPGLAKTLTVQTVARMLSLNFQRIQFTPDLLPADLTGTLIYNPKTQEFAAKKGPVFSNIILADEINRAPAKVQSALLESMQERQVTIGQETFPLDKPFFVLATQNPIEQEGTYPLPEAQVDRFMLKINISYPNKDEERDIINLHLKNSMPEVHPVISKDELLEIRELMQQVYVDDKVKDFIVDIVFATRYPEQYGLTDIKDLITYGASPRASIYLMKCARANAVLMGRGYVIPEDVKKIAPDVLRHRIILSYEAEAENITQDYIISQMLEKIEVP